MFILVLDVHTCEARDILNKSLTYHVVNLYFLYMIGSPNLKFISRNPSFVSKFLLSGKFVILWFIYASY